MSVGSTSAIVVKPGEGSYTSKSVDVTDISANAVVSHVREVAVTVRVVSTFAIDVKS